MPLLLRGDPEPCCLVPCCGQALGHGRCPVSWQWVSFPGCCSLADHGVFIRAGCSASVFAALEKRTLTLAFALTCARANSLFLSLPYSLLWGRAFCARIVF